MTPLGQASAHSPQDMQMSESKPKDPLLRGGRSGSTSG
jgi:hypothetical protein